MKGTIKLQCVNCIRSLYVANKSHKWLEEYHTLLESIEYFVVEGNCLRVTSIEKVMFLELFYCCKVTLCLEIFTARINAKSRHHHKGQPNSQGKDCDRPT